MTAQPAKAVTAAAPSFLRPRSIPMDEVERRVLRACKTIRALPDAEARFLNRGAPKGPCWRIVQDAWDAYQPWTEPVIRFIPKPADVSDVLVAMRWLNVLSEQDFRYIWWRSYDISFSVVAARIGRSDETARQRYIQAMKVVWYEANSSVPSIPSARRRTGTKPGN